MRTRRLRTTPANFHRRLAIGSARMLHTFRDQDGALWWSDGSAFFRGAAPAYLRQAYRAAGLAVDVPVQLPPMLVDARRRQGVRLGQPLDRYEVTGMLDRTITPVEVFAAKADGPEIHVDACYLAYARDRFADCTFWCFDLSCIAVRDQRGQEILGLIQRRPPPYHRKHARGAS